MGLIISKFRKQKTTIELLEEIEKNIATHQRFKRQNQEYQKKFIASLILYSIILYVVVTILFFICYFPQTWKDWLFASIPLLLFPVLIWLVKKLMHWYFVKRISSNEIALQELRDKKKDMLEDVMENETYKKAKEILERFDPARFKKLETVKPAENKPSTDKNVTEEEKVVRQRVVTTRTMTPVMRMPNPVQPMSAPLPHQRMLPNPSIGSPMQMASQMNGRQISIVPQSYGRSPGPPMPRPVPPRERKTLDKFIDYLVGEGPQNRYALICKYCHSHNGMAMREEFEFISFRCCYCYHLNPAKKQRPHAPRLEFPTPPSSPMRRAITAPDTKSSEDKESSGEEEEEDDTSTSSRKSGDETIETEKEGSEAGDGTAVTDSQSAARPAVECVKEDPDNMAMADGDHNSEENTEEGVKKNIEDGTAPNLEPDESAEAEEPVVEDSVVDPPTEDVTETQLPENSKID